ncbi:MAG: endonuclease domain-containing protein [Candidatus Kapaibacteriales bacterium]
MNFNNYNRNLKNYARQNRKSMTKAEASLWKYVLKNRQLEGTRFLRQRVIDNYIVDFCCLELRLVIEVDGGTHNIESVNNNDKIRQRHLEKCGFKVVRFRDEEVLNQMNRVRSVLLDVISKLKADI